MPMGDGESIPPRHVTTDALRCNGKSPAARVKLASKQFQEALSLLEQSHRSASPQARGPGGLEESRIGELGERKGRGREDERGGGGGEGGPYIVNLIA